MTWRPSHFKELLKLCDLRGYDDYGQMHAFLDIYLLFFGHFYAAAEWLLICFIIDVHFIVLSTFVYFLTGCYPPWAAKALERKAENKSNESINQYLASGMKWVWYPYSKASRKNHWFTGSRFPSHFSLGDDCISIQKGGYERGRFVHHKILFREGVGWGTVSLLSTAVPHSGLALPHSLNHRHWAQAYVYLDINPFIVNGTDFQLSVDRIEVIVL